MPLFALMLSSFLLLSSAASSEPASPKKSELVAAIEKIVKEQAARLRVPGGAFGLIVDGEVVLKFAAGPRRLSGASPVDAETLFQIGSIAKTFAAITAVKLQLQKKLQLDQPVEKYLPERCRQKRCEGITLQHLLSHTSGIPSKGLNGLIESGTAYEEVVSKALKAGKICAPGKCFQYNNVAYELAREVLEKVDGHPYADLLKRELLVPLKLARTSTTFAELTAMDNYFTPHLYEKGRFKETTHSTAYYAFPGSSVLNTDLDDMLKLVSAELGLAPEVVPPEALRILHRDSVEAPDAYDWFELPADGKRMSSRYAVGHRMLTSPDLTVVFHGGWVKGCKSLFAVFPERKMGLVVLQNSGSQLGFRILEDVVGLLRSGKSGR